MTLEHAVRPLARRPLFSLLVIAMLALGIGTTTAIFSGIYQALLEPLAVLSHDFWQNRFGAIAT